MRLAKLPRFQDDAPLKNASYGTSTARLIAVATAGEFGMCKILSRHLKGMIDVPGLALKRYGFSEYAGGVSSDA